MKIFAPVTKANIFFTLTVVFYILASYLLLYVPDNWITNSAMLLMPEILILIAVVAFVKIGKPEDFGSGRYRLLNLWQLIPTIAITLALIPTSQLINAVSMEFVKNSTVQIVQRSQTYPIWMSLLITAFVPACCEELMFRGFIFHAYRKKNVFRAILMSGFLFGMFHMNMNQFAYAFPLGVLLAILTEATGSMFAAFVAHFTFNAYSVLIAASSQNEVMYKITSIGTDTYMTLIIKALVGLMIALVLLKFLIRKSSKMNTIRSIFTDIRHQRADEGQGRFFDIFTILGLFICVLLMLLRG